MKRKASAKEVLSRMRRGDLPKRLDYSGTAFDDDTRVSSRVMSQLVREGLIDPAPPHVGAAYTLPAPLTIVVVQSRVTMQWGYGPEHALHLLHLDRDDKPSGFFTAEAALDAARKDRTIPKGTRFVVQPSPTFEVTGSHGEMTVDATTGLVLSLTEPEGEYADIAVIDVDEWRAAYADGGETLEGGQHDVLDFGFWTKDGAYAPPEQAWRDEFIASRQPSCPECARSFGPNYTGPCGH